MNETLDKVPFKITLQAARINKGLSQWDAAAMLGVTAVTLCNYERGKTKPNALVIERMEEIYGIPYKYLAF